VERVSTCRFIASQFLHIVDDLRAHGLKADLTDIGHPEKHIALTNYSAALLAASVHVGRHEREMVKFVKQHRSTLEALPTGFVSINLAEAAVERATGTPEQRSKSAAGVKKELTRFFTDTGWHPAYVKPVAGALRYSKYNPIKRFMMRQIAKATGADTDTSRDHEYTDWVGLDQFVEQFVSHVSCPQ